MQSDDDLIATRRVLQFAIEEQLELAKSWRTQFAITSYGKDLSRILEAQASAEAGRLVNRLLTVQEEIEARDLD